MKKLIPLLIIIIHLLIIIKVSGQNLVPNPGFEGLEKRPCSMCSNHNAYFEYFAYPWKAPVLSGTPNIYSINNRGWNGLNGIKLIQPNSGNSMIGMFLKEHVEIQLKYPHKKGELYFVKFSTTQTGAVSNNNLGVLFSEKYKYQKKQAQIGDAIFKETPQINSQNIVQTKAGNWTEVSAFFIADKPYKFMTIGNFYSADETKTIDSLNNRINKDHAYYNLGGFYYFDDFIVRKANTKEKSLFFKSILKVKELSKNIRFNFDSHSLKEESFQILDQITSIINNENNIDRIEVEGHSDAIGEEAYNKELSEKRANTISTYLKNNCKKIINIKSKGFGSSRIANLKKPDTRRNRRVEIKVFFIQK